MFETKNLILEELNVEESKEKLSVFIKNYSNNDEKELEKYNSRINDSFDGIYHYYSHK